MSTIQYLPGKVEEWEGGGGDRQGNREWMDGNIYWIEADVKEKSDCWGERVSFV